MFILVRMYGHFMFSSVYKHFLNNFINLFAFNITVLT